MFKITPARNQNIPVALAQGFYWAMIAAYFGFIIAYLLELGYTDVQVGWISTLMYLVSTFAGPAIGYITDVHIPANRFLAGAFLISVPFILLTPAVSQSFALVVVCIIGAALLQNLLCGVLDAWVMRIRETHEELSYPVTRVFGSIFYSAAVYGVGFLISRLGYTTAFISNIVFLVITLIVMQFLEKVSCPGRSEQTRIWIGEAIRALLRCREYVIYIVAMVLYLFGLRLTLVFQPNLIFSVGGTAAHVGMAGGVAAIFEIPFILMMRRADRFERPIYCLAALVIGMGKGILMLCVPAVGAYIGAQVFQAVSWGFQIAFSLYYIRKTTPPQLYSTAVMVFTTMNMGFSSMFASLSGGYMFAASPRILLWVSIGAMGLAATVFSLTFFKPREQNRR